MAPRPARGRLPRSLRTSARGAFEVRSSSRAVVVLGLALLLGAAALGGCGKQGGGGSREGGGAGGRDARPDLGTPEAVLVGVADALARGDLEALDARLTPEARAAVRRDLEAFRTALRDPAVGARYVARLPKPYDEAEAEVYRKAVLDGDPAGLLHLLVRASPRPAPATIVSPPVVASPGTPVTPDSAATRLERDLPAGDGTRRRVVLVRQGDAWYVDRLQL